MRMKLKGAKIKSVHHGRGSQAGRGVEEGEEEVVVLGIVWGESLLEFLLLGLVDFVLVEGGLKD